MKSASQKLKERFGMEATTPKADVIQHPAVAPAKFDIPTDVFAEVEDENAKAARAGAHAALDRLKSECAVSQYGDFFCRGQIGRRIEAINIESEIGADYIRAVMKAATGKMPPKSEIDNIRAFMRMDARAANRRASICQRIASHGGARFIDLGNSVGSCVRIGADDWEVVPNTAVPFVRGRGYGELPLPVPTATPRQAFKLVFDWLVSLGIKKSRAALVVVALVAWMRTGNAFPLLLLYGPPGAGKTAAALLIMLLIDPTDSLKLPNIQPDTEHIAAAAQHRHVLTFDNESKLSASEQDMFCTCSTGGEVVGRRLYSNGDIVTLPIHRPVLITAVQPVVTRPDLMSRTIPVEFAPLETRRSEADILAEFLQMRPALLGALCDLLVVGERHE
jgi:hypothetical protein